MDRAIKDLIKKTEEELATVHADRKALGEEMQKQTHKNTERYLQLQRREDELAKRIRALRQAERRIDMIGATGDFAGQSLY